MGISLKDSTILVIGRPSGIARAITVAARAEVLDSSSPAGT